MSGFPLQLGQEHVVVDCVIAYRLAHAVASLHLCHNYPVRNHIKGKCLLQTGKNDLLEVAPVHFLAELGVVPQTTARKPEAKAKADLFYKLNK